MNRFPAMLSLFGLTLLTGGIAMLLHLTWRMGSEENVPPADRIYFDSFYDVALHDLLSLYFFAIALGAGMFLAGLVILFARLRRFVT
jgi:hypothetical protein